MRPFRIFPVLAAILALAACADLRWQKVNGDDAALAQDLAACRKVGAERSARLGGIAPRVEINPAFGPTGASPADVRLQETQAVSVCMRDKGYALVPAGGK